MANEVEEKKSSLDISGVTAAITKIKTNRNTIAAKLNEMGLVTDEKKTTTSLTNVATIVDTEISNGTLPYIKTDDSGNKSVDNSTDVTSVTVDKTINAITVQGWYKDARTITLDSNYHDTSLADSSTTGDLKPADIVVGKKVIDKDGNLVTGSYIKATGILNKGSKVLSPSADSVSIDLGDGEDTNNLDISAKYEALTTTSSNVKQEFKDTDKFYWPVTVNAMADAVYTAPSNTISLGSPRYNSTNKNFDITSGTATQQAVSLTNGVKVKSAGYSGTSDISAGTVTAEGTLAKVKLGTSATTTALTVTPTVARYARESSEVAWIDAANGDVVGTPTASTVYVKVKSVAADGTQTTVSANVNTAGYGTTDYYDAGATSIITSKANASAAYYVPIKSGTVKITGGAPSVTVTATAPTGNNISVNSSSSSTGVPITVNASATANRAGLSTSGSGQWVTSISDSSTTQSDSRTGSATYYLESITVPSGRSLTVTPTGSLIVNSGDGAVTVAGETIKKSDGTWNAYEVVSNSADQGPYYGKTTVKALDTITAAAATSAWSSL